MSKRRIIRFSVSIAVLMATTSIVFAGTTYVVSCQNKACDWEGTVSLGGGKRFRTITGYCVQCGKFVCLRWKRNERAPEPLCRIWDLETGRMMALYKCSDCDKPFAPIDSIAAAKHCPKCKQASLTASMRRRYD